jgi:hypothetical protein
MLKLENLPLVTADEKIIRWNKAQGMLQLVEL